MRIAQILSGFSLAEADVLRKAVGKKDAELIRQELGKFVDKAVERGHDRRRVQDLADQIEAFGRYGFNKSHSAAYSLLSFQTGWLKAHYPAEFMAAMLSSVVDKADDVVGYIAAARELGKALPHRCPNGLEVLPPDVNESNLKFTVVGEGVGQIRFGLGAIRGVGESAVRSIIAAREAEGPFRSLFDLLCRVDLRLCNKRVVEALICAGAMDGFAGEAGRAQLLEAVEESFLAAQAVQRERESAQDSLFGDSRESGIITAPELPRVERWTEGERLKREKEILGFFISGHPLDKFRDDLALFAAVNTGNLKEHRDQKVELACVITAAARQISKRDGSEWGRITVEDFHGTATVLAFGESWLRYKDALVQDRPLLIRGGVSGRERDEEDPPIFLDSAVPLAELRASGEVGIQVALSSAGPAAEQLAAAKRHLEAFPGEGPLVVLWHNGSDPESAAPRNGSGDVPRLRSRSLRVAPRDELLRALRDVLGEERVKLVRA